MDTTTKLNFLLINTVQTILNIYIYIYIYGDGQCTLTKFHAHMYSQGEAQARPQIRPCMTLVIGTDLELPRMTGLIKVR